MPRNSSPFFRRSTPSLTDGAVQNCFSTTRADCLSLLWSQSLVSITYQEASDMMTSSTSTERATMSPVCHSATKPIRVVDVGGGSGSGSDWSDLVFHSFLEKAALRGAALGSMNYFVIWNLMRNSKHESIGLPSSVPGWM